MGSLYKQGPVGVGRYCWINQPDTKYNADGLYHFEHVVEGEAAAKHKALIDAEVDRAFDEEVVTNSLKPAEAKKWSKYYPYDVEQDDEGNPTGKIIFKYKQNAKIHLKDGSVKDFQVGIRDSKDHETDAKVFGGAVLRPLYKARNVKLASTKQFGVRLDFMMVQLIKAAPSRGGGFDEVEGGYVDHAGGEDTGGQGDSGY